MSVIALALQAPWQAWGTTGRYNVRGTEAWPTKSGVIGLLANALGRDWDDDISDLTALRFAVRVDRTGVLETDYHTAGGGQFPVTLVEAACGGVRVAKPDGPLVWLAYEAVVANDDGSAPKRKTGTGTAALSDRAYLADAAFVVALETAPGSLDTATLAHAVTQPARAVYLGRRSCPPTGELLLGVYDSQDLLETLEAQPRLVGSHTGPLSVFVEANDGEHRSPSRPVTFARSGRRYATQAYHRCFVDPPTIEVRP